MMRLKPGDRVVCKIRDFKIVAAYSSSDDELILEILSVEPRGYYLYVPEYFNLKDITQITQEHCKQLELSKKYIDAYMTYIFESQVHHVYSILDGCTCIKCGEFYNMAEPNQYNGTLICFTCRNYPIYKSEAEDDY